MAITPRFLSAGDSADRRLSAPRSLKEAVNCWFSNLSQTLQPRISDSVRLQSQSVSTMAPVSRRARRLDVVERDRCSCGRLGGGRRG